MLLPLFLKELVVHKDSYRKGSGALVEKQLPSAIMFSSAGEHYFTRVTIGSNTIIGAEVLSRKIFSGVVAAETLLKLSSLQTTTLQLIEKPLKKSPVISDVKALFF